jgi:hypothetical protein
LKNFLRDPLENLRTSMKTDWEQTGNMIQIQEFKISIPTPHCLLFLEVALLD